MIGGSILVGAGLLMLGWTSELVGFFVSEQATVWTLRHSTHYPREDLGVKARSDIIPCRAETEDHYPCRCVEHLFGGLCGQCRYGGSTCPTA
jgi:hypothetical protein